MMTSFRNWLSNLSEAMAIAFFHPIKNELPPNIGTHSYKHKPYKRNRNGFLYS